MDPRSACVTSPSSPVPHAEPTGCLVGTQHCGARFRQSGKEASDLWHVRFGRANTGARRVRPRHGLSQRGRTERRAEGGVGKRFWSGRRWMASHPAEVGDTPSPRWYLPTPGWSLVAGGGGRAAFSPSSSAFLSSPGSPALGRSC